MQKVPAMTPTGDASMLGATALPARAADGHQWQVLAVRPADPRAALLWLPALGVPARHYLPLAQALAAGGVATYIHEWRGLGSSNLRAGRRRTWGYRELLTLDLPASAALMSPARNADHDPAGALPANAAANGYGPPLPRIIGGHSLGGQLACCLAALATHDAGDADADGQAWQRLWLVAAGTPYWRAFPHPQRLLLPAVYAGLRGLARLCGHLPGRRLGFAGNEARGLITDWSRVGQSGRYRAAGLAVDLDAAMARVRLPVAGVTLARDWMAPASSLAGLVAKLAATRDRHTVLDADELGVSADHFAWMRQPQAVARHLLAGLPPVS